MKSFIKTIIILVVLIHSLGFAGGKVGNGGGGDDANLRNITPINEGVLLAHGKDIGFFNNLKSYSAENPDLVILKCANDPSYVYPELEKDLSKLVSFKIKPSKNLFQRIFQRELENEEFSNKLLCSKKEYVLAYGTLVMALRSLLKKDEVGAYLLRKTYEKGGPVSFVISHKRASIEAKGDSIEEFTWFDHEKGDIYWAPRKDKENALVSCLSRSLTSFLRHELTHALLFRSIAEYPKDIQYWHDRSEATKEGCSSGIFLHPASKKPIKECYHKFSTSRKAAFIEGLAYAMEHGTSIMPFYLRSGNFNKLDYDKTNNTLFYWDMKRGFAAKDTKIPVKSEVYVASTIAAMFDGFKAEEPEDILNDKMYDITLLLTSDVANMKNVIDAIYNYGPDSVVSFAKAYDFTTSTYLGYRWLREYYLFDYKKDKSITDEFSIYSYTYRPSGHTEERYGTSYNNKDQFYSPYRDELEAKAKAEARKTIAAAVTNSMLTEKIDEILKEVNFYNNEVDKKVFNYEEALSKRGSIVNIITSAGFRNEEISLDDPIVDTIYLRAEGEYRVTIPMMEIREFLKKFEILLVEYKSNIDSITASLKEIQNETTEPGSTEHEVRVFAMLSAKLELYRAINEMIRLRVFMGTVEKVLTD